MMDLAYSEETTYATAPTGNYTRFRVTGESLKQDTSTAISAEIRNDRQVSDVVRTNISASGDVSVELSYGAHDDLFEAGLLSADWVAELAVDVADTGISASTVDDSFNHTSAWGNDPTTGRWIKVSGFADAANNGYFKVTGTVTTQKILVADASLTTVVAGPAITITQGAYIQNGTEFRSFAIEKQFTDLTNEFQSYLGMVVDGFTINIATESLINGSFSFMGKSCTSASASAGTFVDNSANEVMNAIDDVFAISEGDADIGNGSTVVGASLTIANNMRTRMAVGTLGAVDVGKGTLNVTGSLQVYLESEAMIDKYLNFTASELTIVFEDSTGKGYVIEIPSVRYTSGQTVAGGQNEDIIVDLEFTAHINSTDSRTIQISRYTA
jgi:hypothetical protein